jgi:2-polyprenyl-6-methoxyphenol hydroxylase-like FAD-dependent oxidoreductase
MDSAGIPDGPSTREVTCCVVGGGPAGMMLGFLLARAGVDVIVLEKHADFLRDFRGDTVHPSTLRIMDELGLLDGLLALPHRRELEIRAEIGETSIPIADFRSLGLRWGFIAIMPQWDFLDFLARQGRRYPGFDLQMKAEATDLIIEDGRVAGVVARTESGPLTIRATLTVACDGRHSVVRDKAGLKVRDLGAPMDVLWFHLSRQNSDPDQTMGRFDAGQIFVMINRNDLWQCGLVVPKGTFDTIKAQGLPAFRDRIDRLARFGAGRAQEIKDWDDVKLLTVAVDRLERWWRPGLLCIGDAAHAMSPVGGVGVNLAVQDAVAAANELAAPLKAMQPTDAHLERIERRRAWPARVIQAGQVFVQEQVIKRVLGSNQQPKPPLPLRLLARFPVLRRIPARILGIGVRPEHARTPEAG